MLAVKNIVKKFGNLVAVNDISFSASEGCLGFLGPNGAGKSTTMRIITGFLQPDSGSVEVCGFDVAKNPLDVKRSIGYLPEGGPLYGDMTPKSFLEFIGKIRSLDEKKLKERLEYVASNLHLEKVWNQVIDTLSKGYKRRVALAQSILHDPEVLILDEPTDGLDPNQKFEVCNLILSMAKKKTIIVSTHILDEVETICSHALIVESGRIIADGEPLALATNDVMHNSIIVKFSKEEFTNSKSDNIISKLKSINEVENVVIRGGDSLIIKPKSKAFIIDKVRELTSSENLKVKQIYVQHGKLSEAFRVLTTAQ